MSQTPEQLSIAILTFSYPRFDSDEAAVFVKRMVDAFSRANIEGKLIVPLDNDEPLRQSGEGIDIERYRYGIFSPGQLAFGAGIIPNIKAKPLLALQIPGLLLGMALKVLSTKTRFNLVHANWVVAALPAFLIKVLTGTPYVVTLRGEDARLLARGWLKPVLYFPLKAAAAITSVNQSFLDVVRTNYGIEEKKLLTIPNGVSVTLPAEEEFTDFCQKNEFDPDKKYLLFVGTIIPRKRVLTLVEAMACPELKDYQLLLIGRTTDPGYIEQIEKFVEHNNLSNRVHIIGPRPPETIPSFLKLSSFYLSASEFEGRSNSILEALAAGVPVVASDIAEHRELIVDNSSGYLFELGNPEALASRIEAVSADSSKLAQSIENAGIIAAKFSWSATARGYKELFSRLARFD